MFFRLLTMRINNVVRYCHFRIRPKVNILWRKIRNQSDMMEFCVTSYLSYVDVGLVMWRRRSRYCRSSLRCRTCPRSHWMSRRFSGWRWGQVNICLCQRRRVGCINVDLEVFLLFFLGPGTSHIFCFNFAVQCFCFWSERKEEKLIRQIWTFMYL